MRIKIAVIGICMFLILNFGLIGVTNLFGFKDDIAIGEPINTSYEYLVTDLGTLGGIWSTAGGLNNQSYVVGLSTIYSGAQHAFLWINGVMSDLGTPPPYLVSSASNVNDMGLVVGSARGDYQSEYAYLWDTGVWTYLGTLPGLNYSAAADINNAGQIVGYSYMLGPGGGNRAWIYENGNMTDIGTLGGTRANAWAINENGQVVGWADTTDPGVNHAFLWDNGTMSDLGILPNETDGSASDINNVGQICGQCAHTLSTYPFPTFVTACLWDNGSIINIGKLPGYTRNSACGGINDQGIVVGYSSDNGNNPHAFIWENGVLSDLNDMIDPGLGWELKTAADINEYGQIVGYGKHNGNTRGYLLTPIGLVNQSPVCSNENPSNGVTGVSVNLSMLSVQIQDLEGDSFNWSIETSPNIGSNSGFVEYNGTKTCSISGLNHGVTYTWYVNATDSGSSNWTRELYTFTVVPEFPPITDFTYSPLNPTPFDLILFNDTSTDVDGYIVNWSWSFGDGNTSYEQNTYHQYSSVGTYIVTLEVTDDDGLTSSASKVVIVGLSTSWVFNLDSGWNLKALSFNQSIDKSDIIIEFGGCHCSWSQAVTGTIISDFVFGWSGDSYIFVDVLEPTNGYWIYAYQPCILKYMI